MPVLKMTKAHDRVSLTFNQLTRSGLFFLTTMFKTTLFKSLVGWFVR